MSLDVYLKSPNTEDETCPCCGNVSKARRVIFDANVTHNLTAMAEAAGIFRHIWRPEDGGITKASELIETLESGLNCLKADPEKYRKMEPPNRWGTYDDFVAWVERYLAACKANPDALVETSG